MVVPALILACLLATPAAPARGGLTQRLGNVANRVASTAQRFELAPSLGLSLRDPFFTTALPGLAARYHLSEAWSLGAGGEYDWAAANALEISGAPASLLQPPGRLAAALRGEVSFKPLYGKWSLISAAVAHVDAYLTVGGGVGLLQRGGFTYDLTVAIGQRFYLRPDLALRLEAREEFFALARGRGGPRRLQEVFSVAVGLSFLWPGTRSGP